MSADERARAASFVFAKDRDRYVAARGQLRALLGAYLDTPPHALRFAYGAFGKPLLEGQADGDGLCFNLAHSGGVVLFAVAWARRVGVDVEQVRANLDCAALADQVFSDREQRAFAALPEGEARRYFFGVWACKEAYIKATGRGFSQPPQQVEVCTAADGSRSLHAPAEEQALPWSLHAIDAGPGYAAAVVAEGDCVPVRLFAFRHTGSAFSARPDC